MIPQPDRSEVLDRSDPDRQFAIAIARAFGGAIIFGLPLMMTMEMWQLGSAMPSARLALLITIWIPLLVGLSAVAGFEQTLRLKHDALDAFVAIAVGTVAATAILVLLGVLDSDVGFHEAVAMITLQALPGSMGALLASSQFGSREATGHRDGSGRRDTWGGEIFLMGVGANFLAFNVAPTEEIALLGLEMGPWHTVATVIVSLLLMHGFVYAVEFSGQASIPPGTPLVSVFVRYTVVGYVVVLALSTFMLWCFNRLAGLSIAEGLSLVIALGLPGAIGAAAARLIL